MINANQPIMAETHVGHLNQQRKNIRSTSASTPPTESNNHELTNNNEIACLLINIEELAKTQTQHADLTGRLPQSLRGNQYLLISEYRGYIHLEPQASRTSSDYIKSHAATTVFFRRHCNYHESPTILRIDNETSDALSSYIRNDLGMKLEYVPPGNHRTLKAERAIQTAKNHCISTWATTPEDFPVELYWDRILEQIELTLNVLQPYALNPQICAYEGIYGRPYNFNANPIAPCGCKVIVHDRPSQRSSLGHHGKQAYNSIRLLLLEG